MGTIWSRTKKRFKSSKNTQLKKKKGKGQGRKEGLKKFLLGTLTFVLGIIM